MSEFEPLRSDWNRIESEALRSFGAAALVDVEADAYLHARQRARVLSDLAIARTERQLATDPALAERIGAGRLTENARVERLRVELVGLSVFDAVATFAVEFSQHPRRDEFGVVLVTELLPDVPLDQLRSAQKATLALLRRTAEYGSRIVAQERGVRDEMARNHPGFSTALIDRVAHFGARAMR